MLVFPSTIAPAARIRATAVASASGTKSFRPSVPPVETMPSVSCESLMVIGTPCSGPNDSPRASAASAARASSIARSEASCTTALSLGLTSSMRRKCASTVSAAETSLPTYGLGNRCCG